LDGVAQPREHWGAPLAVDAGAHVVVAKAGGHHDWEQTVVASDGVESSVTVPIGEAPRSAKNIPANTAIGADSGVSGRGVATIALGGSGVVGLGLGIACTILARGAFDASAAHCTPRDVCDPRGIALREQAQARATRATVTVSVGAALLAAAALLLALPQERSTNAATAAPRLGALAPRGSAPLVVAGSF
jgi:hypothetical protein